jgi:hypothetical protein
MRSTVIIGNNRIALVLPLNGSVERKGMANRDSVYASLPFRMSVRGLQQKIVRMLPECDWFVRISSRLFVKLILNRLVLIPC